MAFSKYITSTVLGQAGTTWLLEIYKDSYSGQSTEIALEGEGFSITWNGQGGTRDRVFIASECKMNFVIQTAVQQTLLLDTINAKYNDLFVRIYKNSITNSNLWWYGWIMPSYDSIENISFPYSFQLTANDSYGFFNKKAKKTFANETEKLIPHKIKDIFIDFMSEMGIEDDLLPSNVNHVRTSLDWRQTSDSYANDPADMYYIAKGNVCEITEYNDNNEIDLSKNPFDYYSHNVFNGLLKSFNTVGFLAEGIYNFIQPNSLKNNTTGQLRCWEYYKNTGSGPSTEFTLLSINQINNVILRGSTISYEPSFKSVVVNHLKGVSIFNVGYGLDLTNSNYVGTIINDDATLLLTFYAHHEETLNTVDFNFPTNQIAHYSYKTTANLRIKAQNSTSAWYLTFNSNNEFIWQNTVSSLTIERGYAVNQSTPLNHFGSYPIGLVENLLWSNQNQQSGPCSTFMLNNNAQQKFVTDLHFQCNIPYPPISPADISFIMSADNNYFDDSLGVLTNPTPTVKSTYCEQITLNSTFLDDETSSTGISYKAECSDFNAIECYDLGDVTLGQANFANANKMYSFQYLNSNNQLQSISNFQRGNPTVDNPTNATFLLAKEFLELQTEPLEILQADIFSANISPLKLIKYSINDDNNFKYYSFLGGTFNAQSETLSGEWFKITENSYTITGDNDPTPDTPIPTEISTPTSGVISGQRNLASSFQNNLFENSYAITNSVTSGTLAKITTISSIKGALKDGQKILLTYPDGGFPVVLTVDGDHAASASNIDIQSVNLARIYPIGSVISPLIYDLTNVISGGGSTSPAGNNRQIQYNLNGSFGAEAGFEYDFTTNFLNADNIEGRSLGDNAGFKTRWNNSTSELTYLINPSDFSLSSNRFVRMYTRDKGGSVQASTYDSRSDDIMALIQLPVGYKITGLIIYSSSSSLDYYLEYGQVLNNTTVTSIAGPGTTNSNLTLSSPEVVDERRYYILRVEYTSTFDEIRGAKIFLDKI